MTVVTEIEALHNLILWGEFFDHCVAYIVDIKAVCDALVGSVLIVHIDYNGVMWFDLIWDTILPSSEGSDFDHRSSFDVVGPERLFRY